MNLQFLSYTTSKAIRFERLTIRGKAAKTLIPHAQLKTGSSPVFYGLTRQRRSELLAQIPSWWLLKGYNFRFFPALCPSILRLILARLAVRPERAMGGIFTFSPVP